MAGVFIEPAAGAGDGVQLRTVDYRRAAQTSDPAAGGLASVEFDGPETGLLWLIERITVHSSSTSATTCSVYAGQPAPANLADRSWSGNNDIADETSPILLESSQPLVLVWEGASAGARCTASIQYRVAVRA